MPHIEPQAHGKESKNRKNDADGNYPGDFTVGVPGLEVVYPTHREGAIWTERVIEISADGLRDRNISRRFAFESLCLLYARGPGERWRGS